MKLTESPVCYWESAGAESTERTLKLSLQRARASHVDLIVFASTTGYTARLMLEQDLAGLRVVCVTHEAGFRSPGEVELDREVERKLAAHGIPVLRTTHLLGGIDRALRLSFGGVFPSEIVANTLRMFGQGTKVAVEIACMALDAGLLPYGRKVVSIAGTAKGADTSLILIPAHAREFFNTRILEIICKPRNW